MSILPNEEVWERFRPKLKELREKYPYLKLVKEDSVMQYGVRKRKIKRRYLVLMGVILIICKELSNKGKGKYNPRWIIKLNSRISVAKVTDSSYNPSNVEFRLYSSIKTFIFFAESEMERDDWVDTLNDVITAECEKNIDRYDK